jgi:hypothetical protein
MRRRTSLAAATAIGAVWALTACGIPTGRAPEVIGDAPTDFDESSGTSAQSWEPTNDAQETVANFYRAAAGDPASRDDRLYRFTAAGDDDPFSEPEEGIRLIADLELALSDAGDLQAATVTVTGSVVGDYLDDGSVRMHPTPTEYSEILTLQRASIGDAWEMLTLPKQVAIDYDYFASSYEEAPVYFQAGQADFLVPDLRWIYEDLDAETRRRLVLDWLILGPSSDFASQSARNAIPDGTTGRTDEDDGVVRVDLTVGEDIEEDAAEAMAAQIAWSLGLDGEFVLTANDEERARGTLMDWRNWNAIPPEPPETAYFISEATVWQYTSEQVTQSASDHPWVGFTATGLQQVAVGSGGQLAAIVAGSSGDALQTGATAASLGTVAGVDGALADPQWLDDDTLIVIDDGVPTAVAPRTGAIQVLAAGDRVTAMALSADGRRLAYVEGGAAWVAPLGLDADGNITVGDPRQIGPAITNVSDMAWSSENFLWVATTGDNEYKLFNVAIDNSRIEPQDGTEAFPPITQIAANPADPVDSSVPRGEPVIIVAHSTLYRVFTNGPDAVRNGEEPVAGTAPFTVLE